MRSRVQAVVDAGGTAPLGWTAVGVAVGTADDMGADAGVAALAEGPADGATGDDMVAAGEEATDATPDGDEPVPQAATSSATTPGTNARVLIASQTTRGEPMCRCRRR